MGTVKLEYDEFDPVSIEEYARKLVGKTFLEVCEVNRREIFSLSF